jgi:hypothetical protein
VSRRRRRLLAGLGLAVLVTAAAVSPWLVRNTVQVGAPVLTADVGERLDAAIPSKEGVPVPDGASEAGEDLCYLVHALKQIGLNPGRYVTYGAERVGRLWSPALPEGLEDGPLNEAAGYTSLLPVGLLAVVGLVLWRRRGEAWWLLLAPVALTACHFVLVGGWAGERAAVAPALAVLAGAGLATLVGRRAPPGKRDEEKVTASEG